jgi:hypothetical protein
MARLSIEVSEEQKRKIDKYFQWGDLSRVTRHVMESLIILIEKHGYGTVIGAFLSGQIKLEEICRMEDLKNEDRKS